MEPKELKACEDAIGGDGLILVPRDQPKILPTWITRLTSGSSQKPIYWAEDAN